MIDVWLFLAMPRVCLQFVIVVFPDHTNYFWHCVQHCTLYDLLFDKLHTSSIFLQNIDFSGPLPNPYSPAKEQKNITIGFE